jgi:hypothetical protein
MSEELPPTPLLSTERGHHSGIPKRMEFDAKLAKARLFSNKTLPDSVARQKDVPRLPPNISRESFNRAMAELREMLGDANVELNDKPLVDGWYMEHPYVPASRCLLRPNYGTETLMMPFISPIKKRWSAAPSFSLHLRPRYSQ